MTQLREYMRRERVTLSQMCVAVGERYPATVARHARGMRMPNAEQIERYRLATNGEVTSADWAAASIRRRSAPKVEQRRAVAA